MNDNHEKLYDILLNIRESQGRMEARLDYAVKQVEKTNGRVTSLEAIENIRKGKNTIWGAIGGSLAGIIISLITNFLKN